MISAVCIIPRRGSPRCATYRGNRSEFFTCLCLSRQSGEILLGVNTSGYRERKDFKYKMLIYYEILLTLAVCCTLRRSLYDRISRRNRNLIRKYFSLLIRGPNGFESWKKLRSKISWHTPFKNDFCSRKLGWSLGLAVQKPDYSLAEFMFLKNCPQSHEWFLYLSGLLTIIWLVGLMKNMLECLACLVFFTWHMASLENLYPWNQTSQACIRTHASL